MMHLINLSGVEQMNATQEKLIFYTVFKDLDPSSGFKMPQKKFFGSKWLLYFLTSIGAPLRKLLNPLNTWTREVTLQIKIIKSAILQYS